MGFVSCDVKLCKLSALLCNWWAWDIVGHKTDIIIIKSFFLLFNDAFKTLLNFSKSEPFHTQYTGSWWQPQQFLHILIFSYIWLDGFSITLNRNMITPLFSDFPYLRLKDSFLHCQQCSLVWKRVKEKISLFDACNLELDHGHFDFHINSFKNVSY